MNTLKAYICPSRINAEFLSGCTTSRLPMAISLSKTEHLIYTVERITADCPENAIPVVWNIACNRNRLVDYVYTYNDYSTKSLYVYQPTKAAYYLFTPLLFTAENMPTLQTVAFSAESVLWNSRVESLNNQGVNVTVEDLIDFDNAIDMITCRAAFGRIEHWDAYVEYVCRTSNAYIDKFSIVLSLSNIVTTLRFTENGTKICDELFGVGKLPPTDVNEGMNRKAFADGFSVELDKRLGLYVP